MKSFRKILVSSLIAVSIFGGFFAPQADVHAAISKSGFTQTVQAIQYYKNTYGTVTASVLNVRSSAGGSIIGKATKGQKYQVTASTQYSGAKWYQIKFGTSWGWVHSSYLNISTSPTTTPTINKYATVTASALNVRSTPGGTIIGSASRGQKYYVTTSKTYNGATWYCIKYGTRTGWFMDLT